ncbi:serine hydrolase domain-containing protein [Streptomyces sp. MST-110588]|uniref:serine hydrolase domain-containing protein n=1 Tax=Streptomyces sp. MST-110588 TaxID=2833628 RepID=UPI001F5D9452|nr:serine hydrolase domain-containing protein [Streptomyces sp. MST-110588]UNO40201.1 beta-lactamase family protein [Streptomyces sp. MST-110588]
MPSTAPSHSGVDQATPDRRRRTRARVTGTTAAVTLSLLAATAPALAAPASGPVTTAASASGAASPAAGVPTGIDRKALDASLRAIHKAGMYGVYSAVQDGTRKWNGAAGVADRDTGRPVTAGMEQRVGSITKSFVSVAVLQQVAKGRIDLDAPIGRYLPKLVPGERGRTVTVRMLLNHTSGIGDYIVAAFPSLLKNSGKSLDDNRYHQWSPETLIRLGLKQKPTGKPGERHVYSNTNYVIAGELLRKVTGQAPETYVTSNVIRKAGLRHTYFPKSPKITGPHSKMYEALYGLINPPRDYSDYNMSWAGTAGSLVSTMDDLNQFYRALFTGKLLRPAQLKQMKTTVPIKDAKGKVLGYYGLGLYPVNSPCGRFWGHDGAVWGAGTQGLTSEDGRRQVSLGYNLMKYQKVENGQIVPHAIDYAMHAHLIRAMCNTAVPGGKGTGAGTGTDKLGKPDKTNKLTDSGVFNELVTPGPADKHSPVAPRLIPALR